MASHYLLGQWHFLVGESQDALSHFEAALAIAGQTGNLFEPALLLWTAEAEAKLGRFDAALEHLRRYDHRIQKVGALEGLAWFPSQGQGVAHRIRGVLLTHQRAFAAASAEFTQALELLTAHGYMPDLARTQVAVGEYELERGQPQNARKALEMAASCFHQMGFTFELQQTQRMLEAQLT